MMKRKWLRRTVPMLACCLLLAAVLIPPAEAQTAGGDLLSYGLQVLAAGTDMAMSAPVGNEIVFSADAFARALNLSQVKSVTVCTLPLATEGELLLGSSRIAAGQTLSAEVLSSVSFAAADDRVRQASFTFTANGSSLPMVCNLYLLTEENYAPTVSLASSLSLRLNTHLGLCAYGTLSAYDPDGDPLSYEIVSYPKHGAVRMTDSRLGTYVYTPEAGYLGSDSFSYIARDRYGNSSAAARVELRVTASGTSVTYADMQDSKSYNAALTVTEKGIMSGVQVGNRYYFYPDAEVSRLELLVMAMHASGISTLPDAEATVFADDADIPASMKGYVHAAYRLGYVSGSTVEGSLCFLPNESISCAEAAVILEKILGLEGAGVTPTFADLDEIPVWARDAIYALHAEGILLGEGGELSPLSTLTRARAAEILAAVAAYRE
ncbi:MAG: S-layer homology domain-containing protein [Clostridia bacterium]|nr:S-layer homology domain-containing protein [Clostridia bacterium]